MRSAGRGSRALRSTTSATSRVPPESPFWDLDKHTGGDTRKCEDRATGIVAENLERLWAGRDDLENRTRVGAPGNVSGRRRAPRYRQENNPPPEGLRTEVPVCAYLSGSAGCDTASATSPARPSSAVWTARSPSERMPTSRLSRFSTIRRRT